MRREVEQMMDEQPNETNIPQMWKMAALMKMCPKEFKLPCFGKPELGEVFIRAEI